MNETGFASSLITKIDGGKVYQTDDSLAIEEPLEIRLVFGDKSNRMKKNISVTMRTPGNDFELAVGFLFTEGIIHRKDELLTTTKSFGNIIEIPLNENVKPVLEKLERNFYSTSSCGVCGKSSIDAVRTLFSKERVPDEISISSKTIYSLPALLREKQNVFEQTGGLHASALFDLKGTFLMLREDVGRHNALDKLIGSTMMKESLPLNNHVLLLSGRASFELLQKAAMSEIKVVAAVGAPSTLAVEIAKEFNITLIGFLREERFNIYSGDERIKP